MTKIDFNVAKNTKILTFSDSDTRFPEYSRLLSNSLFVLTLGPQNPDFSWLFLTAWTLTSCTLKHSISREHILLAVTQISISSSSIIRWSVSYCCCGGPCPLSKTQHYIVTSQNILLFEMIEFLRVEFEIFGKMKIIFPPFFKKYPKNFLLAFWAWFYPKIQ